MHIFSPINIVYVHQPEKLDERDIQFIRQAVMRKMPRIRFSIVPRSTDASDLRGDFWDHPTITVSFGSTGRFKPKRGPSFQNRPISKMDQYHRFVAAGVASPRTAKYELGMSLSNHEWGDFVILKPLPLQLTSRGDGVFLFRTSRLSRMARSELPKEHMAQKAPMLVQSFIDTGPRPSKQRVTTLLGEPFHWVFSQVKLPRPDLLSPDDVLDTATISTSTVFEREWIYDDPDRDCLDFSRRVAAAFPEIPLLGIDIVRCINSGQLYVLEVNAGGNVWHFSSLATAMERRLHPENFPSAELKQKFFELAADNFIRKALAEAK